MGSQGFIPVRKSEIVFPRLKSQEDLDRTRAPEAAAPPRDASSTVVPSVPDRAPPGPSAAPARSEVISTTLSVRNMHEHGDLFFRYLQARRDVFIGQKGWHLPESEGMEFDQYDTPIARWIALQIDGRVVAGARIAPTTSLCGHHSYMIRDAQLGMLPGLPEDLLYDIAPVRPDIWEATRLFVSETVPSRDRLYVQKCLMLELSRAARSVGATHIIGIVPAVFQRWLKRIGMRARAVGPEMVIDGDRVQAALMNVTDYGT